MTSAVKKSLAKVFAKERIVFWYDANQDFRADLLDLSLPEVKLIEVKNDELAVKYRVMRLEPNQKFLIYIPAPKQSAADNWLLDLVLANHEFQTDPAAIQLHDLGLDLELKHVVADHMEFFRNKARTEALKEMLGKDDTDRDIRLKMIAVVCKTEPHLDQVLFSLFNELAEDKNEKAEQVKKFALDTFLWKEICAAYNYVAEQPTLMDFVLELFKANAPIAVPSDLNRQAVVLLNRWKDSAKYRETFAKLSSKVAVLLNLRHALNQVDDYKKIQDFDAYGVIDQKLIHDLVNGLTNHTISSQAAKALIERREGKHWFTEFQHIYEAIRHAIKFGELMDKLDVSFESFEEGLAKYQQTFYCIDLAYRKFIFHHNEAAQNNLLEPLYQQVEKGYSNEYLLKLNDRWQTYVNGTDRWKSSAIRLQKEFFTAYVEPYLQRGNKVFVVVSDALRYEAAMELAERIVKEDRYQADVKAMLGCLPSFTQLGMASLLPNRELQFKDSTEVFVDGRSSQGTAARSAILQNHLPGKSIAMKAEDFLNLNTKTEGRELFRNNDVIYIFHNDIDATGDKRETEAKVFEAVEREFETLIKLLKKITAVNGTNVLITADHGFLYQNNEVAESDFVDLPHDEQAMHTYNRRFVIGRGLKSSSCAKLFTAQQLNLACDSEFLIINSVHRLRVQGAGSRYVHGGATLQEIVIPVIEVNKARRSDTQKVDVDVIRTSDRITSGQVTISFYQSEPVGEKCLSRELRISFVSRSGELLSDVKTIRFDSAHEDSRTREKREQFTFSRQADNYRNQEVILRMEEPIEGTNQFSIYKEQTYKMQRAFETDFE